MRGSPTLVRAPVDLVVDDLAVDDAGLVRGWLDGDVAAFDALYARHHPALVRLLRGRVGSTAAAEDLAQEVMIRALGRLADFDHRGPLWPWLRRIAINAAIDASRAGTRADALAAHLATAPDRPTAVPDAGDGLLERDVLRRALAEVPDRQRAALERCYVQGWRPSEAAADFGVCPNAFDQLLHRARANLRRAYLRQHEEGHRAAHLGWLLAGLSHVEALSGRVRALAAWTSALGESVPRLGEAAAAAAVAAAVVLGATGGTAPPPQPAARAADAVPVLVQPARSAADDAPEPPRGAAAPEGGAPDQRAPGTPDGPPAPYVRPQQPPPAAPGPTGPELPPADPGLLDDLVGGGLPGRAPSPAAALGPLVPTAPPPAQADADLVPPLPDAEALVPDVGIPAPDPLSPDGRVDAADDAADVDGG